MSYHVMSCHIMSYHVMSCHVMLGVSTAAANDAQSPSHSSSGMIRLSYDMRCEMNGKGIDLIGEDAENKNENKNEKGDNIPNIPL